MAKKKLVDRNPVAATAIKLAEAFDRAYAQHMRALKADLKRKAKGRDGWTPFQIDRWLICELSACSKQPAVNPFDPFSVQLHIRAEVAKDMIVERWEPQ